MSGARRAATLCVLLLAILWGTASADPPAKHEKIAVMDFGVRMGAIASELRAKEIGRAACEYMVEEFVEDGQLDVVDKELSQLYAVDILMQKSVTQRDIMGREVEQPMAADLLRAQGILDPDMARSVARLLGVRYIVYGNVNDLTTNEVSGEILSNGVTVCTVKAHIIARMMDTETGEIVMAAKGEGKSRSSLVRAGSPKTGYFTIGTRKVTLDSVHNALQKSAYATASLMVERLFRKKAARSGK